jgi:hypothetical protein
MEREFVAMCDYSLQSVRSRAAKTGDNLVTKDFRTGTRGFASAEDLTTAVCVLPGTELAFASEVSQFGRAHIGPTTARDPLFLRLLSWIGLAPVKSQYKSAIFRQINKGHARTHHDALEFPDGNTMLLTSLCEGQHATVLQLPAKPRNADEAKKQERVPVIA